MKFDNFRQKPIVSLLTLISFITFLPNQAGAQDRIDNQASLKHDRTCLIVDTDVALDDLRAFAALLPSRAIKAVVVTEGVSSVPQGTTAIALYLAAANPTVPILQGNAAAQPANYDWLPAVRDNNERLNGFLASAVPAATPKASIADEVDRVTHNCDSVEVLALGPWTSFVQYSPVLVGRLKQVIASGRPIQEVTPDDFNCFYDMASCRQADAILRNVSKTVWVDLPTDSSANPSYAPTTEMINALQTNGLPGLLRTLLNLDPSQWLTTRMWDDSAVLYMLYPTSFTTRGAHLEPVVNEVKLRNLWLDAVK